MNPTSADKNLGKRRPTPRPLYDTPTHIRRKDMAHHVWGDFASGLVTDRVISSSPQLHVLEFQIAPGGEFRHSPSNQTIFAADVLYYVIEGELILANPQTGEVVRVPSGTGRLFHRGTWNHGFNPKSQAVRVVEFFSPPPARGAASEYSKTQPPLNELKYGLGSTVVNWPEQQSEYLKGTSFWRVSDEDAAYAFRDNKASHLIANLVSTQFLQVSKGTVQPGHVEDFVRTEKESVIYLLEGELWIDVLTEDQGYKATSVLQAGEVMFLPVGCQERLLVRANFPAIYLRGSAEVPATWSP